MIRMVARDKRIASATPCRFPPTRTIPPVSLATSEPEPMAMPRSAVASAGASLMPSPTMATTGLRAVCDRLLQFPHEPAFCRA